MRRHMPNTFHVPAIETDLRNHGVSVARMCRVAGISQSTWHKLKFNGVQPRESTRRCVIRAVEELTAAAAAAAQEIAA
jgi:predicted transcriptional regulator